MIISQNFETINPFELDKHDRIYFKCNNRCKISKSLLVIGHNWYTMTSWWNTEHYSCLIIKDQNASLSTCCVVNFAAVICVTQISAYLIICICSISFCRSFNCYIAFKRILFNLNTIVLPVYSSRPTFQKFHAL